MVVKKLDRPALSRRVSRPQDFSGWMAHPTRCATYRLPLLRLLGDAKHLAVAEVGPAATHNVPWASAPLRSADPGRSSWSTDTRLCAHPSSFRQPQTYSGEGAGWNVATGPSPSMENSIVSDVSRWIRP